MYTRICDKDCDGKQEHYNRDTGELTCACGARGGQEHSESCCDECAKKIDQIHTFLFTLAQQMEALGNNPMVKALVGGGGFLPKLGGRNGKDKR